MQVESPYKIIPDGDCGDVMSRFFIIFRAKSMDYSLSLRLNAYASVEKQPKGVVKRIYTVRQTNPMKI